MSKVENLIKLLRRDDRKIEHQTDATRSGAEVYSLNLNLLGIEDRYYVDYAEDFSPDWRQFDTDQDAWYFGVWYNVRRLLTLTYAEGDCTLTVHPDKANFEQEMRRICEFYGPGVIAIGYDEAGNEEILLQDRDALMREIANAE